MKLRTRMIAFFLLLCTLVTMLPITALSAFADGEPEKEDAMEKIEADEALKTYKQGETLSFDDDGYIGVPYKVTVYFDSAKGAAKPGYMTTDKATPVILYVVNADFERIGTDPDASIIKSMVERGYAVAVLDYLNNAKATGEALDYSAQLLRGKLGEGAFFADKTVFPAGTYRDNLLVPAGYDVLMNEVFFELDKHGTDGTLEKIVNVWNNDFRLYKKDTVIKWVHEDGTRKATQKDFDGGDPVWYSDAAGKTVDAENGTYIKVKHTKAEVITDCVMADGRPIDLNLYAHVIYPTNPKEAVPIMTMFSSAGYLMTGSNNVARPHMQHFLFNGYAGLLYDYAWIPMGRNDHYGYFDGSSGEGKSVTGDNQSYATYTFNAAQSTTAANRFVRYLALTQPETYKFRLDKLGVFGISKAAWMTHLGAPILREDLIVKEDGLTDSEVAEAVNDKINGFYQQLWLPGHHGETRYDNGITESYTKDGFTIDGGEIQPYAVFDGNEISSGAEAVYSSCGAVTDYIDKGYSPLFITLNLQDTYSTEYGKQNEMANLCRVHDVPSLWLEADIAHTFADGVDYNHGVDTYKAFMDFFDYYLKDTPASVLYTAPRDGYAGMSTVQPITVKFIGQVSASEIEKISVTDKLGNKASGTWASSYGNTEWTFNPDGFDGLTEYVLTVPAELEGENGKAIGKSFTVSFWTQPEVVAEGAIDVKVYDYQSSDVTFTVPTLTDGMNEYKVRVKASYGVNKLTLLEGDGKVVSSVNVSGEGWYELDVFDAVKAADAGSELTLKLKTEYSAGSGDVYTETFDEDKGATSPDTKYAEYDYAEIDGAKAMKVVMKTNEGYYKGDHYYYSYRNILTASKAINGGAPLTKEDLRRTFLITLRVYDTVQRQMRIQGKSVTSKNDKMLDYDRLIYNFTTKAGGWVEITVPYTVYETEYGTIGNLAQALYVYATPTGDTEMPLYIDSLTVTEVYNDLALEKVQLVAYANGEGAYKEKTDGKAFTVGENGYDTWKAAISTAKDGDTVKLNANYVFTSSDFAPITVNNVTIDLNGYKLVCDSEKSPIALASAGTEAAAVTVKNGRVFISDAPFVSYIGDTDKAYNVAFTDLYIGVYNVAQTAEVISASAVTGNASVSASFELTDCVIDINRGKMAKCQATVLPKGGIGLDISYTFIGGKLILDSRLDLTFSQSALTVKANGEGEFTKLYTADGMLGVPAFSLTKDGEFCEFVKVGTENGYAVYEAQKAAVTTGYGIIPEQYANASEYPVVIFSDNCFIAAKKTWPETLEAVIAFTDTAAGATVQVLLRDDLDNSGTPTRMYKINGTLVFDLNGKTLKSNSATLFEFGADASYTGAFTSYTTKLVVKNGTLVNDYGKLAAFENKTSSDKHYEVVFENVRMTVSSANARSEAIVTYNDSNNTGVVYLDFTFTDCTFDFTDAQKKFTVIKANAADSVCSIKVNGGKMISDTADSYAFFSTDELDSVVYGKGSDGKYLTLTLNEGESAGSDSFKLDDGMFYGFGDGKTEGGKTTYSFVNNENSTPYGMIPDGNDDRFVIFAGGKYITSGDDWNYITRKVLDTFNKKVGDDYPYFGDTVYLIMRSDYRGSAGSTRVAAYNGTLVFDLMGNTFTRSGTLFESEADTQHGSGTTVHNGVVDGYVNIMNNLNGGKPFDTNITVKNGSIVSEGAGNNKYGHLIAVGGNHKADKKMTFTFENIDFGVKSDPSTLFAVGWGTTDGAKMDMDIVLNNCDFTFPTDTATGSGVFVRNGTPQLDFDIYFNGGTINGDMTNLKLCNNSVVPEVFFGKYAGKYTTLTVPTGSTYPVIGGTNEDGKLVTFAGTGTVSGTNTTYSLVENDLITPYGVIDSSYADVTTYPIAVFNSGKFVGGYDNYPAALKKCRESVNGKEGSVGIILLRNNVTNTGSPEKLYNLNGTIVIDLNGYTLENDKNTLFEAGLNDAYAAEGSVYVDYVTKLIVKNGTLTTGNGRIFATENPTAVDKTFDVTFDDVTFKIASDSDRDSSFIAYNKNKGGKVYVNIGFKDCDFDFATHGGKPMTNFIKMDGADIVSTVSVIGGKVSGSLSGLTFMKLNGSNGTVLEFYRGKDGEYPIFKLTAGNPPAKLKAIIDEKGNYRTNQNYTAVSTVDGVTTYKLGKMCKYGLIEPEYNYEKGVPFVIFMDGKAVAGASNWANTTAALKTVLDANPGATVTVYVQYDTVSTNSPVQMAMLNGTVNIDLNGHTLTGNAHTLFECGTGNYNGFFDTKINVFNGTVIMGKGRIAVFESKSANDKHFAFTFENVTFDLAADFATTSGMRQEMFFHWDASGKGKVTADIDFISCTFDFRGATAEKPVTFINIDSPNLAVNTTVTGGSIIADTAAAVNFYVESATSPLTMVKDGNGVYTTSSMEDGTVLGGTYATADENLPYGEPVGGISTLTPCNHTYDSECDGECNLCGSERTPAPHVPSESWTVEADKHYKTCTVDGCGAKLSMDKHSGGSATCTDKAVCQFCGGKYGETDSDNHAKADRFTSEDGQHWYACLNGCGEKLELDGCSSEAWISNGEKHHKECDVCDAVFNEDTCSGGEADCMNKAVCDTCENEYGEKDADTHVGSADGKWYQENDKHYKKCECGAKLNEDTCSGGKADCMNKAVCDICENEYGETAPDNHAPSFKMKHDGTHHWYECINCGEVLGKTEHVGKATCTSAAICYDCGATFGEPDANAHKASAEWMADENGHWHECVNGCGTKVDYEAHKGGKATCTEKAVCTVCGREYGALAEHSYSDSWTRYGSKHWHECECGAKKDEAVHSYGEWTVTKEATETEGGVRESVCECGDKRIQVIPVISRPVKSKNASPVAVASIALGATAAAGAAAAGITLLAVKKKRKK